MNVKENDLWTYQRIRLDQRSFYPIETSYLIET